MRVPLPLTTRPIGPLSMPVVAVALFRKPPAPVPATVVTAPPSPTARTLLLLKSEKYAAPLPRGSQAALLGALSVAVVRAAPSTEPAAPVPARVATTHPTGLGVGVGVGVAEGVEVGEGVEVALAVAPAEAVGVGVGDGEGVGHW